MKNIKYFAMIGLMAFSMSASAADVVSESSKTDGKGADIKRVAFVDLIKIVNESKAVKTIDSQIQKLKAKYQGQAKAKENALKAREKELAEQKKALSKEAFEKKVVEFRKKIQSDEEQVMRYQKILQTAYGKALEALKVQSVKIVGEYAQKNNIDMVFPKSQLLYGIPAYDITDQVLNDLNSKVPEINITVDEKTENPQESDKKK